MKALATGSDPFGGVKLRAEHRGHSATRFAAEQAGRNWLKALFLRRPERGECVYTLPGLF